MSITITKAPPSYVLSHNQVLLEMLTPGEKFIQLIISLGNVTLLDAKYIPDQNNRVSIDISKIINSIVKSEPIAAVSDFIVLTDFVRQFTCQIIGSSGATQSMTSKALYGGISKKLQRSLSSIGLDIFSYRLTNYTRQFVFTTRTNSRHIVMRESEITPLLFIMPENTPFIQLVSDNGRMLIIGGPNGPAPGTLCALNIQAIRKHWFNTYKEVASYFSVLLNDSYIFDISFTQSMSDDSSCLLLFRNSLGCYEAIECTGIENRELTLLETEEILAFDKEIGDFTSKTQRNISVETIQQNIGFKTAEEFEYIKDLLSSDDIYLLKYSGKTKVLVSAEEIKKLHDESNMHTATLLIKPVEQDYFNSPELDINAPSVEFGEWILLDGVINDYGFIYDDYTINN